MSNRFRVASLLAAVGVVAAALTACDGVTTTEVGACIDSADLAGETIHEIKTVPCDTDHDMEVFHIGDLPDGEFPGEEAVAEAGTTMCYDAFEPYVGTPYEESALDFYFISPTEESWDSSQDREVICLLTLVDDVTNSSLKNSGL